MSTPLVVLLTCKSRDKQAKPQWARRTYLAYYTEPYRPLLRTQPGRFVVLPLLVTVA